MSRVETLQCGSVAIQVVQETVMGVVHWPAAQPLAQWLLHFNDCHSLLELGCGAGVCSMAFAKAHSTGRAVLLDNDRSVLKIAERNASLNDLYHRLQMKQFDMFDLEDPTAKEILDEHGKFPLIIGSDVICTPAYVPHVLACATLFLEQDGRLVLSVSQALASFIPTLLAKAEEAGFHVEAHHLTSDGTGLVALVQGTPKWQLPPFQPEETSSGPVQGGADRADLLFADY